VERFGEVGKEFPQTSKIINLRRNEKIRKPGFFWEKLGGEMLSKGKVEKLKSIGRRGYFGP